MRIAFVTVQLMVIYAMALGSADPWDLALGAVLGLGLCLAFRRFLFPAPALPLEIAARRALHFPRLALATVVDITRGTFMVARIVLSPRIPREEGFVGIPFGQRTESGVKISGLLNTLSPGSVLIDIDNEGKVWTIHAIDLSDEEGVIESAQEFYERYQRPVWP